MKLTKTQMRKIRAVVKRAFGVHASVDTVSNSDKYMFDGWTVFVSLFNRDFKVYFNAACDFASVSNGTGAVTIQCP